MAKKTRRRPVHAPARPNTKRTLRARANPKAASTVGRRRRLSAEAARAAILDAAEELLIASGPDALRLMEVAARAGVAHANISYHFGNVAGLQAQLAQRIAAKLADDVAGVYRGDETRQPPFERAVSQTFRVFDERGYARLLAWLALAGEEPTFEALGRKLEMLCAAIAAHPGLRGSEGAERRRRYIVPSVQLTILAAVGNGLVGRQLEALFPSDARRASIVQLLCEVFGWLAQARP